VASGISSAVETHGPGLRRGASSLGAEFKTFVIRAWDGVDETVVRRNGRSETVHRLGVKERLGSAFARLRKFSGLYRGHDLEDAKRGDTKKRATEEKKAGEEKKAAKA
jgi:hypothetical protein